MEFTVIGCWGAYPAKNEATSGYLLRHAGSAILLDCGSGVLSRLQNEIALEQLDAVFITHTHADHFADAYALEFATLILTQIGKRTRPLDMYIFCDNLDGLAFAYLDYVRVHPIEPGRTVSLGELRLSFSVNVHDVPCCAVKVTTADDRSLVYSGDTGYCQSIVDFAANADLLVLESSFYDFQKGVMRGHLTAGEAGEIASLAKAGQLILTHFPHYGDRRQLAVEAARTYDGPVKLAYCGMKMSI